LTLTLSNISNDLLRDLDRAIGVTYWRLIGDWPEAVRVRIVSNFDPSQSSTKWLEQRQN
jgi:hypothetical protein